MTSKANPTGLALSTATRYRSQLEIMYMVLNVNGRTKTQLAVEEGISPRIVRDYLELFVKFGLLESAVRSTGSGKGTATEYVITNRGRELLEPLDTLSTMMSDLAAPSPPRRS